jgi:hypothetical protein
MSGVRSSFTTRAMPPRRAARATTIRAVSEGSTSNPPKRLGSYSERAYDREVERLLVLGMIEPPSATALDVIAGLHCCRSCPDGDLLFSSRCQLRPAIPMPGGWRVR